jgi:hypothetical protein
MPNLRVYRSEYIFKWLTFLAVIAVGIWWTLWQLKVNKGMDGDPAPVYRAELTRSAAPAPPVKKAKARKERARAPEAPAARGTDPEPDPASTRAAVDAHDYNPYRVPEPAPMRVATPPIQASSEPKLGLVEEPKASADEKRAGDGVYRAKLKRCAGAEGRALWRGRSDGGELCFDAGQANTLYSSLDRRTFFEEPVPGIRMGYNPDRLNLNDLVKITVNDDVITAVMIEKSVR